ncbi:MAG: hypothetical protein H0T77_14330 [Pyrinomonadaceae bacterium]|jgi:hypothetical protein|nr:hypothetical protein [Pyrinomonadaceae bacterium]
MKIYSSNDHSSVSDRALSLPHFDEDATLLSARPVVPLHEVKTETHSKRHLIFGLTILMAILIGAISATLLLMPSGQNSQSVEEAEVSEPSVSPSGAAGGFTSESAEATGPGLAEPDEEPQMREVPSARNSSIKRRTEAILRSPEKPSRAGSSDRERDEDVLDDERESLRAERRDARREVRREIRRRREQTGDDLLRIREIFEGSPRP